MPKLFQINVCSAMLSTGKIAEDISKVAISQGWSTYLAWGRYSRNSVNSLIHVGNTLDNYIHYASHKLFDLEGLMSKNATKKLINQLSDIAPDIIHLHNIHDHYLNYPLLFNYLATLDTPVIWTQHDCWAFTGGCMYYDLYNCEKWKSHCEGCPQHRAVFGDKTERQFDLKRTLLSHIKNLTYVPVSYWLERALYESHQSNRPIITIHNGIDITVFRPLKKNPSKQFHILGVAAVWNRRKGLEDFIELRKLLPSDLFTISLVGLSDKQIGELPDGIRGIKRTENVEELVRLYSDASVFVNPTYSDNFPTTNIEALACGTPVITYRTGGSPEAIDEVTGCVIDQGDIKGLSDVIMQMSVNPLSSDACRKRAVLLFDKDKCFNKYMDLYNQRLV